MRHRKEKRQLGRTTSHRQALLRNLVTSLLERERIQISEGQEAPGEEWTGGD